jgi:hypothetical protein
MQGTEDSIPPRPKGRRHPAETLVITHFARRSLLQSELAVSRDDPLFEGSGWKGLDAG